MLEMKLKIRQRLSRYTLGQSYNANDNINSDTGDTIHPQFSESRMKVEHTFLLQHH